MNPAASSRTRHWNPPRLTLAVLLLAVSLGALWYSLNSTGIARTDPSESQVGEPSADHVHDSHGPLEQFDLENIQVPADELRAGGPPKDGIPALTSADVRPADQRLPGIDGQHPPRFVPASEASFLRPDDRVVGVEIAGEARAYPIRVLTWHEIINDVVGKIPIAVIYCPLCDSASVVDRRVNERTLEFGVSGLLHQSNIVLYDRSDMALWSQVGLRAISGPLAGHSLNHMTTGWALTAWDRWRQAHPDTSVLSLQTGHRRDYSRSPYKAYFEHDRLMFPVPGVKPKLPNKEPVIGIRVGEKAKAYPLREIRKAGGVIKDNIADQPITIEADDNGVSVSQAPDGAQVVHTFWFTWSAFWPDTELYEAPNAK